MGGSYPPTKRETDEVVMNFLEDRIFTCFKCPMSIVTDNAKAFSSLQMSEFCMKHGFVMKHSSNYYPQGNDLAESSNKKLMRIIKKIVGENKKNWDSKIK